MAPSAPVEKQLVCSFPLHSADVMCAPHFCGVCDFASSLQEVFLGSCRCISVLAQAFVRVHAFSVCSRAQCPCSWRGKVHTHDPHRIVAHSCFCSFAGRLLKVGVESVRGDHHGAVSPDVLDPRQQRKKSEDT